MFVHILLRPTSGERDVWMYKIWIYLWSLLNVCTDIELQYKGFSSCLLRKLLHNDWIASETKNNHRMRDAIFSAQWKLISDDLAPHFKDNERKRRKREKIYYCRRDCISWKVCSCSFMVSDLEISRISRLQWGCIMWNASSMERGVSLNQEMCCISGIHSSAVFGSCLNWINPKSQRHKRQSYWTLLELQLTQRIKSFRIGDGIVNSVLATLKYFQVNEQGYAADAFALIQ